MGTINGALSMMTGAMNSDQAALNIVSNNVANSNTPGYTAQSATWSENSPVTINGVQYGSGATMTGPTSHRDKVLQERLDQQQQLAASTGKRLDGLNTLQTLFTPDSGSSGAMAGDISSDMTNFFNSFSSLEANPTDNALRQKVLSTATTLAGDVSNAATSLSRQQSAVDQEAAGVISQVNALTTSLAQLNQQIQSASDPNSANTLEDQRQQDISQLSQLIGINQVTTENNGLTITTTSGQTLVAGNKAIQIGAGMVNGVTHFFASGTDITTQLESGGGQLGGYLTVRDQDIPSVQGSLDQLAFGITTAVNTQNQAGIDLNGNAGGKIFNQPAQVAGAASGMSVVMTNPNQVAAAGVGQGTGDNSNATVLANLLNQTDALLNNQTPTNFFSGFVTGLGSTISQVQTENTALNASVSQLQTQYNSETAVNLNDEASALTVLERSYQSASQVFTILDKLIAESINLGMQTTVS